MLQAPMEAWLTSLRRLLAIDPGPSPLRVRQAQDMRGGVTEWQVRVLERAAALGRIRSARQTLDSLRTLVDSIPNMIVGDGIGDGVARAAAQVAEAEAGWAAGKFDRAVLAASMAQEVAEAAFFDETMLSQLYFPDDHKLAVYVPFFVPVLLPIVIAIIREVQTAFRARSDARRSALRCFLVLDHSFDFRSNCVCSVLLDAPERASQES